MKPWLCFGGERAADFQPGALVRFLPQPGAYSPTCAQASAVGQTGLMVSLSHGDYAAVTFGGGSLILCPVCYLERVG